jgi:hypothetical protein
MLRSGRRTGGGQLHRRILWQRPARASPESGQRGTLPAFRHEVQTFSRFGVPLTTVRTRWMFGLNRRLVRRWLWETLLPKPGPLAQMSQTAATGTPVCEGRGAPGVSHGG